MMGVAKVFVDKRFTFFLFFVRDQAVTIRFQETSVSDKF